MLVLTPDMRAAAYDPATDAWRDLPAPPLPDGSVIAEWAGHEWLVVAMGAEPHEPAPAASFDLESGTWRTLAPSPLSTTDEGVDALWTGDRLLVLRRYDDGVSYDPASDRWETFADPQCAISTGERFPAVWTGEVILSQRFLFDPSTGECRALPPAPARDDWNSNSYELGAVAWTGAEFLVWGGGTGGDIDVAPADGAAFRLPSKSAENAPSEPTTDISLWTSDPPVSGERGCLLARGGGYLVPHAESGLGVADAFGDVWPIVWPFGYTARQEPNGAVLVDPAGCAVAREGQLVQFGGGLNADGVFAACGGVEVVDRTERGHP